MYSKGHVKTSRNTLLQCIDSSLLCSGLFLLLISLSFSAQSQEAPLVDYSDTLKESSTVLSVSNKKYAQGIQYDAPFIDKKLRKRDQALTVFGYYRLFLYGRNMTDAYPNLDPYARAYGVGDGYREPMMSVTVLGRPSSKATFGTELFLFSPYAGKLKGDNVVTMNLGINFYGNFRTDHGNFGVRAGGIHWYNLSPFTMGVYQVLDKFSIFDRTPWEGVTNTIKYDSYYATGATSPGDLRWNNRPFQGIILNGSKLPGDFKFDLFWGKMQANAGLLGGITDPAQSIPSTIDAGIKPTYLGFNGQSRVFPNYTYGGKLERSFGKKGHTFSYNNLSSVTALDSLDKDYRKYAIHSLALDLNVGKMKVTGELAMGNYESPTYDKKWGEALMLKFSFPKEYTFLPLDFQIYQISKDFYNQNGEISTNSNPDIIRDYGIEAGANSVGGSLTQVNQLAHNRRGINLNTGIELGDFKFNVGWGLAQELESTSNLISYVHRINGLALSRVYNPFPANATSPTVFGPYGNQISFFRGVSEVVQTTDLDPASAAAINKKYFNAVDLQAKLKAEVLGKKAYLFYLGTFLSASDQTEIIPTYNDNSYLFVQYHEFDLYYEILPKFIITGYVGLENTRGGRYTQWDTETNLPRDQFAQGYGLGFDWMVAKTSGIYFRHRWMEFEDKNFGLNHYKGQETTIELKTFF